MTNIYVSKPSICKKRKFKMQKKRIKRSKKQSDRIGAVGLPKIRTYCFFFLMTIGAKANVKAMGKTPMLPRQPFSGVSSAGGVTSPL